MRKKPYYWTDELLHAELISICAATGSFPSNSDLQELGRNDLSVQITRRGGFVEWAKRMGYTRNRSDSDFGWEGEQKAMQLLKASGFDVQKSATIMAPYDLLVDHALRVDVKTANFATYGICAGWFYRIGKHVQCDLLMLYQADTNSAYYLPWFACPVSNITISKDGGIYAAFKDNIDLVKSMAVIRGSERIYSMKLKKAWLKKDRKS